MAFPTTSAPTLSNYQYSYNGLTMGLNTPYQFAQIDGLDLPGIRTGDVTRPREHGEFIGIDLYGGRDITFTGDVTSDGTSLQSALTTLGTATPVGLNVETPLWLQLPNLPTLGAMVRVRKRALPVDISWAGGLASAAIQWHATDPRLYAQAQSSSIGLGTPLGGMTFPASFPLSFGGGTVAGVLNLTNSGNVETRPVLTIAGPVTTPTIKNTTTGWSLTFTNSGSGGYTVNAGDTLVIDLDTHSVQYFVGGTGTGANRRSWVVGGSVWPSTISGISAMAPGNNSFSFTSQDASAVAGTMNVQWASAYVI